jgi:hypothetical protein
MYRLMLFENKVQRRIFGPKRGEVAGRRRKLRNEDHDNLYSPLNTFRMIQLRKLYCEGHVFRIEKRRSTCKTSV